MTMKFNAYILTLLLSLFSKQVFSEPYVQKLSELNFSKFLPIRGNCEMDAVTALVTDLPGSQMCIISDEGVIAHYRIIAPRNTSFNIRVNERFPVNSDGLTFTPVGKITSDMNDITIVPGQTHVASSGDLGRVDIKFGGQLILTNTFVFGADRPHKIEMEAAITWSEVP
jgi:hypothetical protein